MERGCQIAASSLAASPCCAEFEWTEDVVSGVRFWTAKPKAGVCYRIFEQAPKTYQCYLTTGPAYKFCRPITDDTHDLDAAKSVCSFHWHNTD